MKKIKIFGQKELNGEIKISGAKNSAVALIPAALLCDEQVIIENVPNISDIDALIEIMEYLGANVQKIEDKLIIDSANVKNKEIPENKAKKLRASYYFMSALLGKFNKVEMYFPGGCSIGARPIDQTLKGFKSLGATIKEKGNKFNIYAEELTGNEVVLDMPSVGATINTILVATKAKGVTIIKNAAKEPEIVNVVNLLKDMGAKIKGEGTDEIIIVGVNYLKKAQINVIPDRIEAGTYLIAGALMGNNLKICNIIPKHIESLINILKNMGFNLLIDDDSVTISRIKEIKPIKVETKGYPGFPTDLQQPLTVLLTLANGKSELVENIYENRFQNVPYLNQMGSDIIIDKRKIFVAGPTTLKGCKVVATDLRAGACLVLAGLYANGLTVIEDVEHILRGYENIISKLTNVGANIELVDE